MSLPEKELRIAKKMLKWLSGRRDKYSRRFIRKY